MTTETGIETGKETGRARTRARARGGSKKNYDIGPFKPLPADAAIFTDKGVPESEAVACFKDFAATKGLASDNLDAEFRVWARREIQFRERDGTLGKRADGDVAHIVSNDKPLDAKRSDDELLTDLERAKRRNAITKIRIFSEQAEARGLL